jgi:hypothetical protein
MKASGSVRLTMSRFTFCLRNKISMPGGEVTGWLDRKLHQAVGRAVHQPPPSPAVHAGRSPDLGRGTFHRTDRASWYVQLEGAHPDPDLAGVNLHARHARAGAEEQGVQPGSYLVQPGLAVADGEPLRAGSRGLAGGGLVLADDGAPGGGVRLTGLRHALARCCFDLVVRHRALDPAALSRRLATAQSDHDGRRRRIHARAAPLLVLGHRLSAGLGRLGSGRRGCQCQHTRPAAPA